MGTKIAKIGVPSDKISGHSGLALILLYNGRINLYTFVMRIFQTKVKEH